MTASEIAIALKTWTISYLENAIGREKSEAVAAQVHDLILSQLEAS